MNKKNPDTFKVENTPDTSSANTGYSATGTQIALDMMANFAQKSELATFKELVSQQYKVLEISINDIKSSLKGREIRFWIINGIIISALVSIFLFALPLLYQNRFEEKTKEIKDSIININSNINMIFDRLRIKKK